MSWMAFFVTFVVWFNHAPLMSAIKDTLGLSKAEVSILLTLNVALAIPARIIIGMLTDKYGPRSSTRFCSWRAACRASHSPLRIRSSRRRSHGSCSASSARGSSSASAWSANGSQPTNSAAPRASTAAGATSARPQPPWRCRRSPCCSAATRAGATPSAQRVYSRSSSACSTTSTSPTRPRARRTSSRRTWAPSR